MNKITVRFKSGGRGECYMLNQNKIPFEENHPNQLLNSKDNIKIEKREKKRREEKKTSFSLSPLDWRPNTGWSCVLTLCWFPIRQELWHRGSRSDGKVATVCYLFPM